MRHVYPLPHICAQFVPLSYSYIWGILTDALGSGSGTQRTKVRRHIRWLGGDFSVENSDALDQVKRGLVRFTNDKFQVEFERLSGD